MAKLALSAAPTFKAVVPVPVAGGASVNVEMTFRHRTKTALAEFVKSRQDRSDGETFLEMVGSWELDDPLTPESVDLLLENHIGAALATYHTYIDELLRHKAKN